MSKVKDWLASLDWVVGSLKVQIWELEQEVKRLSQAHGLDQHPEVGATGYLCCARCLVCGRVDFEDNLVKRASPGGEQCYAHADCGLHVQLAPKESER